MGASVENYAGMQVVFSALHYMHMTVSIVIVDDCFCYSYVGYSYK